MNFICPSEKDLFFLIHSIDNVLKDYYYKISVLEDTKRDLYFYLKEIKN